MHHKCSATGTFFNRRCIGYNNRRRHHNRRHRTTSPITFECIHTDHFFINKLNSYGHRFRSQHWCSIITVKFPLLHIPIKTSIIRSTQNFFNTLLGHSLMYSHHLFGRYITSKAATEYYPQREKQDYMYIFHNRIVFSELMYDQRPSYSLMKSFILVLLLENVRVPITVKKASLSTILGYIIFIIFSRSLSKV